MTNVLIVDDERMVQELFSHYIAGAGDRYRLVGAIKGAGNAEVACMKFRGHGTIRARTLRSARCIPLRRGTETIR
jgi:hypothetical protein